MCCRSYHLRFFLLPNSFHCRVEDTVKYGTGQHLIIHFDVILILMAGLEYIWYIVEHKLSCLYVSVTSYRFSPFSSAATHQWFISRCLFNLNAVSVWIWRDRKWEVERRHKRAVAVFLGCQPMRSLDRQVEQSFAILLFYWLFWYCSMRIEATSTLL